ncbi:MAG TPA: peptide-methionine (S)-S-oxide reductase, partial [Turneriella sp.]|nr:peptide-methionine (S)-S-oxide reductase [Turneriella sp.]
MGFILKRFSLPFIFIAFCAVCGKSNAAGEKTAQDPKTTFSFERPFVLHDKTQKVAIFAGGCFWCMESPFEKLAGVKAVIVGYTDGKEKNPTYSEVSYGNTGHVEAVLVVYNPKVVQ